MRFLIAGLAMMVATSVAAHDETSDHSHASVEPAADASIVENGCTVSSKAARPSSRFSKSIWVMMILPRLPKPRP